MYYRNEELVLKIKKYLEERNLFQDASIYYNNKLLEIGGIRENFDIASSLEYYNPNTISIGFKGELYRLLTYGNEEFLKGFNDILNEFNLYYDFGYSWSISLYEK